MRIFMQRAEAERARTQSPSRTYQGLPGACYWVPCWRAPFSIQALDQSIPTDVIWEYLNDVIRGVSRKHRAKEVVGNYKSASESLNVSDLFEGSGA